MIRKLLVPLFILATVTSIFAQKTQPVNDQDIAAMQQLIDAKGYHWIAGHTTVSDLTPEQRQGLLGFKPPKDYDAWLARQPKLTADPRMVLPVAFDWRDSGIVTPVKNQGGCGSCWAFGATGAFEANIKHYSGITYDLAEQQPLSCNIYGGTCAGGWIEPVYELFKRYGAVGEACMPYQQSDVPCTQDQCAVLVKLKGWVNVANDINSIKQAVLRGPVATGFTVYDDFFNYTSGCYQHTYGGVAGGHIVVIVGWDDNFCGPDEGAWICKNSWGPGWGGLGGYFFIKWGDSGIGSGTILPLYPPDPVTLAYADHAIADGAADNDKIPDPGESFMLPVSVTNAGLTTATGVQGILRTSTPGVVITDSTADFPNIPYDQVKTSLAPHFSVHLDSAAVAGTRIDFTLQMTSAQGSYLQSFYDYVGKFDTVFVDGMELGPGNWTHGGTFDDWQCGKPMGAGISDANYAHTGSNLWGNNLSGNYQANANNYLESKAINCSYLSHTKLRYYRWLSTEKGIYDNARIVVNGKKVWENDPEYDQVDAGWIYHDIDISGYADGEASVKIRFEMQSDVGLQLGGWSIDDIAVLGIANFVHGDANGDKTVDVSDAVYLIEYIFSGGSGPNPPSSGDNNCDNSTDISDVVYLIAYIFGTGPAPTCK
jgi:C1A family cysteine protease